MAERIAILCVANNYGPPRTAHALTRSGAEVCIVAPPGSYAALTRFKHADLLLSPHEIQAKMPGVIGMLADEYRADSVIAGDDLAFCALARLVEKLPTLKVGDATRALLARSLPPPNLVAVVARDCEMVMARARSACPSPPSVANPSEAEALAFANSVGFPVLVKRDGLSSGRGVTLCETSETLRDTLRAKQSQRSAFGQGFVVHKLLFGTTYGVSVAGVRGKCLAAFSFVKHVVHPKPFGPTSVAKPAPREDIIRDAREIYETFELNGFAGFDYVVDYENKPHFLEINPRIMPTTHLGVHFGADLVAALLAHLRGQAQPTPTEPRHEYVALYPNERLRDARSSYFSVAHHDEPLEDPEVHAAMLLGKG